jgi:hypothetical protein
LLRVSVDLPFEDDLGRLCRLGYGIERQPHGQSSAVDHHADCGTKDTPGTPGIVGDGGEVNLQAQQQDFVHRIKHLAALARVRQLPEMIKKNDRFGFRPISSATSSIAILRGSNQRITTEFSTLSDCHAVLHPIALCLTFEALDDIGARARLSRWLIRKK